MLQKLTNLKDESIQVLQPLCSPCRAPICSDMCVSSQARVGAGSFIPDQNGPRSEPSAQTASWARNLLGLNM